MELKIKITYALEDWRENTCQICGESKEPNIRFCYEAPKPKDKYGNRIVDGEIELCEDCAKKFNPRYKRLLR